MSGPGFNVPISSDALALMGKFKEAAREVERELKKVEKNVENAIGSTQKGQRLSPVWQSQIQRAGELRGRAEELKAKAEIQKHVQQEIKESPLGKVASLLNTHNPHGRIRVILQGNVNGGDIESLGKALETHGAKLFEKFKSSVVSADRRSFSTYANGVTPGGKSFDMVDKGSFMRNFGASMSGVGAKIASIGARLAAPIAIGYAIGSTVGEFFEGRNESMERGGQAVAQTQTDFFNTARENRYGGRLSAKDQTDMFIGMKSASQEGAALHDQASWFGKYTSPGDSIAEGEKAAQRSKRLMELKRQGIYAPSIEKIMANNENDIWNKVRGKADNILFRGWQNMREYKSMVLGNESAAESNANNKMQNWLMSLDPHINAQRIEAAHELQMSMANTEAKKRDDNRRAHEENPVYKADMMERSLHLRAVEQQRMQSSMQWNAY